MKDFTQFFKALSDETRLQIIALLLMEEELCVCDIENILQVTQSKVSRHLRYLVNSGVLTDTRRNIWVYYSINKNLSSEEFKIIDVVKKGMSSEQMDSLKKLIVNRQCCKKKVCCVNKSTNGSKV